MKNFYLLIGLIAIIKAKVEMTDWYVLDEDLQVSQIQEPKDFTWNNLPKTAYASSIKICESLGVVQNIVYQIKNFCNDKI